MTFCFASGGETFWVPALQVIYRASDMPDQRPRGVEKHVRPWTRDHPVGTEIRQMRAHHLRHGRALARRGYVRIVRGCGRQ
jgi:hypothetical protein